MDAVKAGEIYLCDFSTSGVGSMQGGVRPCVIVDNRMACVFSPCIHCVPLTSQDKKHMPLHYKLNGHGLYKESTALCEQYTLVDKSQLTELIFIYKHHSFHTLIISKRHVFLAQLTYVNQI